MNHMAPLTPLTSTTSTVSEKRIEEKEMKKEEKKEVPVPTQAQASTPAQKKTDKAPRIDSGFAMEVEMQDWVRLSGLLERLA
jgi:hypothetical protein